MLQRILLITMVVLATEKHATAEAARDVQPAPPATKVQAAPGGGEMLILDRASRYITRGGVDEGGRLTVDCGREENGAQSQQSRDQRP